MTGVYVTTLSQPNTPEGMGALVAEEKVMAKEGWSNIYRGLEHGFLMSTWERASGEDKRTISGTDGSIKNPLLEG